MIRKKREIESFKLVHVKNICFSMSLCYGEKIDRSCWRHRFYGNLINLAHFVNHIVAVIVINDPIQKPHQYSPYIFTSIALGSPRQTLKLTWLREYNV